MAFGETLTLLATLANAYQALRFNRPPEAAHETEPAIDPLTLMAFDFAKSANNDAVLRHESTVNRLHALVVISGFALLISAFLGALSTDAPEGGSPLFIASISTFVAVLTAAIVLKRIFGVTRIHLEDHAASLSNDAAERLIDQARSTERQNTRSLTALEIATDGVILGVALQVVLAALWLIS